jgi:hypothetical protein
MYITYALLAAVAKFYLAVIAASNTSYAQINSYLLLMHAYYRSLLWLIKIFAFLFILSFPAKTRVCYNIFLLLTAIIINELFLMYALPAKLSA